MKVVTLVENTVGKEGLEAQHGISLYIETKKHKVLVDVGADGLFLRNAKKLGVDISQVDTVVITHGHSDHGGGMKYFLQENSKAKVYIRDNALVPHYTKLFAIPIQVGLDSKDYESKQVIQTGELHTIDDELTLFSNVSERELYSSSNHNLYAKESGKIVKDEFSHEQNLLISCNGKQYLIGGCGHSGAVNILERAVKLSGCNIDVMITGLHIMRNLFIKGPGEEFNVELAKRLKQYPTQFYTLHCTGKPAYEQMKQVMGDQMKYLSTGDQIQL